MGNFGGKFRTVTHELSPVNAAATSGWQAFSGQTGNGLEFVPFPFLWSLPLTS